MYDYNHAIQVKADPRRSGATSESSNRAGRPRTPNPTRPRRTPGRQGPGRKDQLPGRRPHRQLKVYTKNRDDLIEKADTYMIPLKFQGRVHRFAIPRFPRFSRPRSTTSIATPSTKPIARVDRCQSCHMGDDKKGFENAPQPFRTHSNFDAIILKHPPEKTGCTPCHEGQGPAVNSVAMAHGDRSIWDHPLLQGDEMQSRCITCHIDVGSLRKQGQRANRDRIGLMASADSSRWAVRHVIWSPATKTCPRSAHILKLARAKLDPSWTVRWITDPHIFRPHTRMPNFMFSTRTGDRDRGLHLR